LSRFKKRLGEYSQLSELLRNAEILRQFFNIAASPSLVRDLSGLEIWYSLSIRRWFGIVFSGVV
jgi:hypothetical protein